MRLFESARQLVMRLGYRGRVLHCGLGVAAIALIVAAEQPARTRTLAQPEARHPRAFVYIRAGLREMSDGSLLLIDTSEKRVFLVDKAFAGATAIARTGSGPGEYVNPTAIMPLTGDTSAIRDGGSGSRLLVVAPDGTVGRFLLSSGLPFASAANPAVVSSIAAADHRGGYYALMRPSRLVPGARDPRDSLAIVRWTATEGVQRIVAYLPSEPPPGAIVAPNGMRAYPAPINIPFWTRPQWAVAPDGRVAVVHHNPYRIELFDSAGKRLVSARPAPDRIRVSAAHKTEWLGWYEEYGAKDGIPRNEMPDPGAWPDYLPPFVLDAVRFDMRGQLWIRRTTIAGAPPTFDVVDSAGRIAERVILPQRTRLVGFGLNGAIYLARSDDDGFDHLERHRLPP